MRAALILRCSYKNVFDMNYLIYVNVLYFAKCKIYLEQQLPFRLIIGIGSWLWYSLNIKISIVTINNLFLKRGIRSLMSWICSSAFFFEWGIYTVATQIDLLPIFLSFCKSRLAYFHSLFVTDLSWHYKWRFGFINIFPTLLSKWILLLL